MIQVERADTQRIIVLTREIETAREAFRCAGSTAAPSRLMDAEAAYKAYLTSLNGMAVS